MASNDLFITPKIMMEGYRPNLLEINSHMDSRLSAQAETRERLYGEGSDFEPDEIGIRYEPDTQRLYIDANWVRKVNIEEAGQGHEYITELRRGTQYVGEFSMSLLKGTGHVRPPKTCLIFDMNRACAPSAKVRNRTEATRDFARSHRADPEYAYRVDPLLDRLKTLQNEIRDKEIDLDTAKYLFEGIKKERKLLERLKFKKATDVRTVSNPATPKKTRLKLNIMALAKDLAATDNLMVRQLVQDIESPDGHREVIVDAVGEVLGYLKQDRKERKLYLVVSHLKKKIPNYRRDYRYTHSQTTYLTELHDDPALTHHYAADKLRLTHKLNKYCAVFDLKRPYEGGDNERE